MQQTKEQVLARMCEAGVVAVIRAKSKDQLVGITEALLASGVPSIEVTTSTPDAIAGIAMLCEKFGDRAIVGVGTVLDAATAERAMAAGAQFVVSPISDPQIIGVTLKRGRISIPGAFTPTEIYRAWMAGADVVKVFPATSLGPQFFRDILAPLPQLKLTPTGGVDAKNTGEWIKAGAVCVGAGSALVSKAALEKNDWNAITQAAKAFVEAVRQARGK